MEADRPAIQGIHLYPYSFFFVPKIGIIKLIFTVAIFVIEGFDYFTTSKENMLTYFIDDLVMVGCGNQASSRYSRCPGRKYVI